MTDTWTWRLSRPIPFASFDTSVFHAYDTDHRAACDQTKTVVESVRPVTGHSPRCETCQAITEGDPLCPEVCMDLLRQDGWLGYCAKAVDHEPPHEGTAVHAENSEISVLCWDREAGGIE